MYIDVSQELILMLTSYNVIFKNTLISLSLLYSGAQRQRMSEEKILPDDM